MIDDVIYKIILKHARLWKTGRPVTCNASHEEEARRETARFRQIKPKIIYDTREAAEAAEREMFAAVGGSRQRAYLCQRSRHGHHHLTRKPGERA